MQRGFFFKMLLCTKFYCKSNQGLYGYNVQQSIKFNIKIWSLTPFSTFQKINQLAYVKNITLCVQESFFIVSFSILDLAKKKYQVGFDFCVNSTKRVIVWFQVIRI
jgi:hypothetical protein